MRSLLGILTAGTVLAGCTAGIRSQVTKSVRTAKPGTGVETASETSTEVATASATESATSVTTVTATETAVTPVAPQDPTYEADDGDPTKYRISWRAVAGADAYDLLVATNSDCSGVLRSSRASQPPLALTLDADGTYYVCIQALRNGEALGPPSEALVITVDHTPPGAFAATAPLSLVKLDRPQIAWSAADGAATYHVVVGRDAACTDVAQEATAVSGTTWTPTAALIDGTYHVCVTARDVAGNTTPATGRSFAVDTHAPVGTMTRGPTQLAVQSDPPRFVVTFDEALAAGSLTAASIQTVGTGVCAAWQVTEQTPGLVFAVDCTSVTTRGSIKAAITAGGAADEAGNGVARIESNLDVTVPVVLADVVGSWMTRADANATVPMTRTRLGQRAASLGTPLATVLTDVRLVPDPKFDTADGYGEVDGAVFDRYHLSGNAGRPTTVCGDTGSIGDRITDCAAKNGASASWSGARYGQDGEGDWSLVTVASIGGRNYEVWRDERTKLVWSDSTFHLGTDGKIGGAADAGTTYNWFRAAGYSCAGAGCPINNDSSVAATWYEGAAGVGAACGGSPCQPATPITVCKEASLLANTNGVLSYQNAADQSHKANLDLAAGVLWRLPTLNDWLAAIANGARKVLPNMGHPTDASRGQMFWALTSDANQSTAPTQGVKWAFRVSGSHGELPSIDRTAATPVRCVGGVDDPTEYATVEATPSYATLTGATAFRNDTDIDFRNDALTSLRTFVPTLRASLDATLTDTLSFRKSPSPSHDTDGGLAVAALSIPARRNYLENVACLSGDTAPCRPTAVCGATGTISERIADCRAKNGVRASWDGVKYGFGGEGAWSLVRVTDDASAKWEVWRDERTLQLWSDSTLHYGPDGLRLTADDIGIGYNWFQAAGWSCSGASCPGGANSSVTWTGIEGAAGQGTACAGAACQPAVPVSVCADAAAIAGLNGVAAYVTPDVSRSKGGLSLTSSPKVAWRLPTQHEFYVAIVNGARQVLPNADYNFWTATSASQAASTANAVRVAMRNGYSDVAGRNTVTFGTRCVGGIVE